MDTRKGFNVKVPQDKQKKQKTTGGQCPEGCIADRRTRRSEETSWGQRRMETPFGAVAPKRGWKEYAVYREMG